MVRRNITGGGRFLKFFAVFSVISAYMAFGLSGCERKGNHKPVQAIPVAEIEQTADSITYRSVQPIFEQYCSRCHPSMMAPDWTVYEQALPYVRNGKLKNRVVDTQTMPLVGSPEAQQMTGAQRQQIAKWIEAGAPKDGVKSKTIPPAPRPQPQPRNELKQALAAEWTVNCNSCHGTIRASRDPNIPYLAGQNSLYLEAQIHRFKNGQRDHRANVIVNDIMESLDEAQIKGIANYFSKQASVPVQSYKDLLPEEKEIYLLGYKLTQANCRSCHATQKNRDDITPRLDGQQHKYVYNQMVFFRSGRRRAELNPYHYAAHVKPFTEEELNAMAEYFSHSSR